MLEKLKLERPLVFFDLETTGANIAKDRIIEICIIKINPDKSQDKFFERINPQMPISKEASEIHGIYDEDVKDKPTFQDYADEIFSFLKDADIGGYNLINFDLPLINKEFERVKMTSPLNSETKIIDPMRIYHKMEKRDLSAAYKFFCGKELTDAHSAEADILATIEVLDGQIDKYELALEVDELDDFCRYEHEKACVDLACRFRKDENGEIVFNFGSNNGKKVKENLGMLKWMLDKDFSEDTKDHARKLLEKFGNKART